MTKKAKYPLRGPFLALIIGITATDIVGLLWLCGNLYRSTGTIHVTVKKSWFLVIKMNFNY